MGVVHQPQNRQEELQRSVPQVLEAMQTELLHRHSLLPKIRPDLGPKKHPGFTRIQRKRGTYVVTSHCTQSSFRTQKAGQNRPEYSIKRRMPMNKENLWWKDITFDFIKVPKDLFRVPQYSTLSPLAKLLYSFLLDRTSLSAANGEAWIDEFGSHFVYFPITEIMERFGCGHDKAAALLDELERADLIARSLKSRRKPYRIIAKPFAMSSENKAVDLENPEGNKTKKNKTDSNKTQQITAADRERVAKEIKENICYEVLLEQVPRKLLNAIVDVIVDTLCSPTPTVRIGGNAIPRAEVCRRLRALNQMDIYYVNDSLKRETSTIHSLCGYILARLYEAKNLSDTYYGRWARQDMSKTLS